MLLAAALMVAYEDQHDLYVSARRAQNFYRASVTTKLTQWLNSCVENDPLITNSSTKNQMVDLLSAQSQPTIRHNLLHHKYCTHINWLTNDQTGQNSIIH